ncbi:MAG TPA: hypothetical protein VFF73_12055 [Planctomycetota bacterium]|nr:hypothetical protein [Planctomycetota bacterium]
MPEDLLSSARETVTAFVQAARCCAKYPPGHARRAETFEFLAIRATAHGERWGDLKLELAPPRAIVVMGNPVHEDGTPDHPPIAQAFAQSGIRALTLESGIAREELQQLVEIFGKLGKNDEDIVCALWRAGLWAVQLDADDDIDKNDSITAAETVAIHERIEDARQKARERTDDLSGAPPQGRDWAVEAPPPAPISPEETRAQLTAPDLAPRAFEVTKTALWRVDSPLPPEHATKLFVEVIKRALQNGDLPLSADLLDKADPDEAPTAAVRTAEKTTSQLGAEIVRCVPSLYVKLAAKGEETALAIALRCLNHLDTAGVQKAAAAYADVPAAGRRPLRRVLSARGAEALEGIVRIADHKNLEIAKDGLAMLAVTPLDAARKAIERFANDPTTPRDRLELAKGALAHHQQLAPKASKTTVSAVSQQLCSNLRDPSREKRLAAARSLAKMGPDNVAFTAVQGLVTLPGFPQADEEEQKALIDALVGSGGDGAIKVLETVAMKTLGLPTSRMCRQAADTLKRARGAKP